MKIIDGPTAVRALTPEWRYWWSLGSVRQPPGRFIRDMPVPSLAIYLLDVFDSLEADDDFGYHHARTSVVDADHRRTLRRHPIPSMFG